MADEIKKEPIQQGVEKAVVAGSQQQPALAASVAPVTQEQIPQPVMATPVQSSVVPQEDIDEKIRVATEKARADEKAKVFAKLDELKAQKKTSDESLNEANASLEKTQGDLESIRAGKTTENESFNREVRELKEQNNKLQKAIEAVADSAAAQVAESKLDSYRERKIREAGLEIPELVGGASKEEIDASVKSAMEKESKIKAKARAEATKAAQVQEDAKTVALQEGLPAPISPDGSHGLGPQAVVTPGNRRKIASLKGEEYKKARRQLLEEAKQKAGLP